MAADNLNISGSEKKKVQIDSLLSSVGGEQFLTNLKRLSSLMEEGEVFLSDSEKVLYDYIRRTGHEPSPIAKQNIKSTLNYTGFSEIERKSRLEKILREDAKSSKKATSSSFVSRKVKEATTAINENDFTLSPSRWGYSPSKSALLDYYDKKTIVKKRDWVLFGGPIMIGPAASYFFSVTVPKYQRFLGQNSIKETDGTKKVVHSYLKQILMKFDKFKEVIDIKDQTQKKNGKNIQAEVYDIKSYNLIKEIYGLCKKDISSLFRDENQSVHDIDIKNADPQFNKKIKKEVKRIEKSKKINPNNAYHFSENFIKDYLKLVRDPQDIERVINKIGLIATTDPLLKDRSKEIVEAVCFFLGNGKKDKFGNVIKSEFEQRLLGIPYAHFKKIVSRSKIIAHYIKGETVEDKVFSFPFDKDILKKAALQIKDVIVKADELEKNYYDALQFDLCCEGTGEDEFENSTRLAIEENAKKYALKEIDPRTPVNVRTRIEDELKQKYKGFANDDSNILRYRYCALDAFNTFFFKPLSGGAIRTDQGERQIFSKEVFRAELEKFNDIYTSLSQEVNNKRIINKQQFKDPDYDIAEPVRLIKESGDIMKTIGTKLSSVINEHIRACSLGSKKIISANPGTNNLMEHEKKLRKIPYCDEKIIITPINNPLNYEKKKNEKGILEEHPRTVDQAISYIRSFCLRYAYTLGSSGVEDPMEKLNRIDQERDSCRMKLEQFPKKISDHVDKIYHKKTANKSQ